MSDGNMLLLALRGLVRAMRSQAAPPVVPEPEFVPFQLPSRRGAAPALARAQVDEVRPANTTSLPRTLEELGVPGTLAAEMEATLRLMGNVEGDRIVGYSFRTPDGVAHPLRAGRPSRDASDRAA